MGTTVIGKRVVQFNRAQDRSPFPRGIGLALVQFLGGLIFYNTGWESITGILWGVLIASGIFYVIFQLSGGQWIGGGDVKLGFVLGVLLGGPLMSMLMLFVASCLGTIAGLPMLLGGKRQAHIAFGPFLLLGTIIVQLFGAGLIHWYKMRVLG